MRWKVCACVAHAQRKEALTLNLRQAREVSTDAMAKAVIAKEGRAVPHASAGDVV